MNFTMAFKMAGKSILGNKMRTFLTMLGIIIGVCSVIALISIGKGSTKSITESISQYGSNMLIVNITGRGSNTMDPETMTEFIDSNSDVFNGVAPVASGSGLMIKYGNKNTNTTSLEGTNEKYADIRNTHVGSGRFLTASDVEHRQRVVLIGTYLKQELFDGSDPLGKQIKINGYPFTVVGVIEEKQDSSKSSTDDRVIIPYSAATRLLRNATIRSYYTQARNESTVETAKSRLQTFLYKKFSSTDAYSILDQKELMETVNQVTGMLTSMLAGIAGISLLVGGIGIMNIMLVSVTERTREIGIRKAIGAKRRDILGQFLIESVMLSALGGIVGIALGIALGNWLGKLLSISAIPDIFTVLMAFSFSMCVGVFFGLYPANKASKLNPIEALRFE